jgi:hypothetical protein
MGNTITVEYDLENGYLFADGKAEEWVNGIINKFHKDIAEGCEDIDWDIKVCSYLLVDAFRVKIAEGRLSHKDIIFRFKGENIKSDKYGRLQVWPKGFCDVGTDLLERLLTANAKAE